MGMENTKAAITEYDAQAFNWANKHGVRMTTKYTGHRKYSADDKDTRDTYSITLLRNNVSMTFDYGASLVDSKAGPDSDGPYWRKRATEDMGEYSVINWRASNRNRVAPTLYNVLTCIEKDDCGTFEGWCGDFGYGTDSRKALETYLACQKHYGDFLRLCGNDAEMMREAQDIQ